MNEHYFKRLLKMKLPKKQSAFLWGARKSGKSSYLKNHFPESIYYDLLLSEQYVKYSKEPNRLREEILALPKKQLEHPIIIDEIQKIPMLLNEVHWMIENTDANFILCGSSARKLKRGAANLLGGRAWRFEFYPLTFKEIPGFDLLHALNNGLLPSHYLMKNAKRSLRAYIHDYLKEEIQEEGLVRKLPAFAKFLDSMAFSNGEMTVYSNIASDCGINSKTVKEYYQILVDTLIGYYVYSYRLRPTREIETNIPKFYLFDVGVAGYLSERQIPHLKGSEAGKAFEHFILMELTAYRGLHELEFDISYWRTKNGVEVDFILGRAKVAIEVKISSNLKNNDFKGLKAFLKLSPETDAYLVCHETTARKIILDNGAVIHVIPWHDFLEHLWASKII